MDVSRLYKVYSTLSALYSRLSTLYSSYCLKLLHYQIKMPSNICKCLSPPCPRLNTKKHFHSCVPPMSVRPAAHPENVASNNHSRCRLLYTVCSAQQRGDGATRLCRYCFPANAPANASLASSIQVTAVNLNVQPSRLTLMTAAENSTTSLYEHK